ncbi:MAG TPA: DUF2249 domain-containing protein [Candidatus Nanopelagicales bacterium]|nr:DUF2249 domain-containing protein [Candidatus Nanopelagicales bacterium]
MDVSISTSPQPLETTSSSGCGGGCGCGGDAVAADVLDVRLIPHSVRRASVLAAIGAVRPSTSLVLLAPHDPAHLLEQVGASFPDEFGWTYDAAGPETWAVRLTRR